LSASATHLLRIVDQAVVDAEALERAAIGARIDTDRRTVKEVADVVLARSGWPDRIS
jgi:cation transport ATPase